MHVPVLLCDAPRDEVLQCSGGQALSPHCWHIHSVLWTWSLSLYGKLQLHTHTHTQTMHDRETHKRGEHAYTHTVLFYIVALFLIITGVFIYNIHQPSVSKKNQDVTSYKRCSEPSVDTHRDTEQAPKARGGIVNLRDLLESSMFETSTSEHIAPVRKKNLDKETLRHTLYPLKLRPLPLPRDTRGVLANQQLPLLLCPHMAVCHKGTPSTCPQSLALRLLRIELKGLRVTLQLVASQNCSQPLIIQQSELFMSHPIFLFVLHVL